MRVRGALVPNTFQLVMPSGHRPDFQVRWDLTYFCLCLLKERVCLPPKLTKSQFCGVAVAEPAQFHVPTVLDVVCLGKILQLPCIWRFWGSQKVLYKTNNNYYYRDSWEINKRLLPPLIVDNISTKWLPRPVRICAASGCSLITDRDARFQGWSEHCRTNTPAKSFTRRLFWLRCYLASGWVSLDPSIALKVHSGIRQRQLEGVWSPGLRCLMKETWELH